jgi:hypothetical protein
VQTFQIVVLMTCAALYSERAISIRASAHLHRVRVTIVSLPRKVAGRMAIHAARVMEGGNDRLESGGSGSVVAFIFVVFILLFMALGGDLKEQQQARPNMTAAMVTSVDNFRRVILSR